MNKPALIGIHRSKLYSAAVLTSLGGGVAGNRLNLIAATALITLNIDNDRIVEANLLGKHGREDNLKSIESHTMTTNKNGEVTTVDVEDQLALVTVIFINRTIVLTKASQDRPKNLNRSVCDLIYLVISEPVSS